MADAELAELATLVNGSTNGILDVAAKARLDEYNTFVNTSSGSEGEEALAAAEKAAADTAVAASTGALWTARDSANTAWSTAKSDFTSASSALSTALDSNDLAALRATVASDTLAWET